MSNSDSNQAIRGDAHEHADKSSEEVEEEIFANVRNVIQIERKHSLLPNVDKKPDFNEAKKVGDSSTK